LRDNSKAIGVFGEPLSAIYIANLVDRASHPGFHEPINLVAELWIIQGYETHVSKSVRLYKQENLIVGNMAPHNVFKSSNFSDRFLVPTLVRSCP
jgi:hypothetical protein